MDFASDNVSGASPAIMQAVIAANEGAVPSYGEDDLTRRMEARFDELFERRVAAVPVLTGTAANALALSVFVPGWGSVLCHEHSHIVVDEANAPAFYTGGATLDLFASADGKITAEMLAARLPGGLGVVHHAQPSAVSLTQSTESGTVYTPDEVAAIAEVAHAHGLAVHMDGARFANAVAALGCTPADLTWRAGVDVLSFGATKNGAIAAEAVILFDGSRRKELAHRRKRAGHLLSKMRFLSAQLDAYLAEDLWLANARHANAAARRLAAGLAALPNVRLRHPVEANEVFVELPDPMIEGLIEAGARFYRWDEVGPCIRLVTAWDTPAEAVDHFLAHARRLAY